MGVSCVEDTVVTHAWGDPVGQTLENGIDHESCHTSQESDSPLRTIKTLEASLENESSELGDQNLTAHNNEPKNNEHGVFEDAIEHVPLIMDLTAADHVHDLHEHERGEDERVVAGRSFLFCVLDVQGIAIPFGKAAGVDVASGSVVHEHGVRFGDEELSSEEEQEEGAALPKSLVKDVLGHSA